MKKIDAKDLNLDEDALNENAIKGEIAIEMLIFRQIERTSQAASQDESIFAANVRILLSMIPATKRNEITTREDEYKSIETHWEYKHFCGVPLGTPEEPINGSPFESTNELTDWHQLFQITMESLEESGLIWKRENETVETGEIEDKEAKIKPTPVLSNNPTQETEQPIIPSLTTPPAKTKKLPTCRICGKHVEVKTGTHYKGRLVHIQNCFDLAKVKWADQKP